MDTHTIPVNLSDQDRAALAQIADLLRAGIDGINAINTAQDGIAAAARGITQDLRAAKAVRS